VPFTLKLRDVIIGRSDLEARDPVKRTARGAFRPGIGYELVEPIFDLADASRSATGAPEQSACYRSARDTLALALYARDGALLETSRIDIVRDDTSRTGLAIDVDVVDDAFWSATTSK
jgi:hypothetical protein